MDMNTSPHTNITQQFHQESDVNSWDKGGDQKGSQKVPKLGTFLSLELEIWHTQRKKEIPWTGQESQESKKVEDKSSQNWKT